MLEGILIAFTIFFLFVLSKCGIFVVHREMLNGNKKALREKQDLISFWRIRNTYERSPRFPRTNFPVSGVQWFNGRKFSISNLKIQGAETSNTR